MRTCILGSPPVFGWVFLFAIKGVKRLKKKLSQSLFNLFYGCSIMNQEFGDLKS